MHSVPGKEATLAQCTSVSVECGDCGRTRWLRRAELRHISDSTRLSELGLRLFCAACRDDGLSGKSVSLQASFADAMDRERAEAFRLNSRTVLCLGRHATSA